jgi:hypothetical protein
MMIKRIYIAGPITPRGMKSDNLAIDYLLNVRDMIRVGVEAMLAGFTPFIPAMDLLIFLGLKNNEMISDEQIKKYSIDWLSVSDAMVLTSLSATSEGVRAEIKFAHDNGIPVFDSLNELIISQRGMA